MTYFEIEFQTNPISEVACDILKEFAGEAGCESFIDTENGFLAYSQQQLFKEEVLKSLIASFPLEGSSISYKISEAEYKNWNETWENESFKPIIIDNRCVIHSSKHEVEPMEYDIKINPEMSFGSGQHETTSMIIQLLMDSNLSNDSCLDMGCGTGILSIMASMKGAKDITAIDIDEWSVRNAKGNCELNNITNVDVILGDANLLATLNRTFSLVLANINKNILIADFPLYAKSMRNGARIIISGFYTEDLDDIVVKANELGITLKDSKEKNNWCCALLEMQN